MAMFLGLSTPGRFMEINTRVSPDACKQGEAEIVATVREAQVGAAA